MTKKLKSFISAFSLIELSIVILIASILAIGGLSVAKTGMTGARSKVTNDRMTEVAKALAVFVANNKRLPCPGVFSNVKTNSSYGNEAATPGTCTGTITSSSATNLVYGMVPIKALNLAKDFAEDSYETRFSYVVDKRYTTASGFEFGASYTPSGASALQIIDIKSDSSTGPDVTTFAVVALISHGTNKLGGYSPYSTSANSTTGIVSDESDNIASGTFDINFVINSTNSSYDDILLFRTKGQLIREAGWEHLGCSSSDSAYYPSCGGGTVVITWNNTSYGQTGTIASGSCSSPCTSGTAQRRCDKYGVWSSVISGCN